MTYTEVSKQMDELLPKFEQAVRSFAGTPTDLEAFTKRVSRNLESLTPYSRFKKAAQNFYSKMQAIASTKWLNHMTATRFSFSVEISVRASSNSYAHLIRLSAADEAKVVLHEMGHTLEWETGVSKATSKSMNWLRGRAKGADPVRYNEIAKYTEDTDKAYKDKFFDPYVGKFYNSGHTEVFSMGLQNFTSYESMLRFAVRDFDHFSFVHGVLAGAI